MDKIFTALASTPRRKILAYLSATSLTAGEIAERFEMSKPSLSKHLSILENAGLISREKKGQFVHYSLVPDKLTNTLNGFAQSICPVGGPLIKESKDIANKREPLPITAPDE
ncbi:ArsR family transcriptional regulator [Litorimonas taeanensis]|uniref:ArsR family transcriptional regulator n=1 Tax=Litorimonas taeanensis TaxID=568099 RepID=A0A420WM85_9PROT|nr:metalloregulator ArsR/SmtB family transcription factor [Litorimonas taeanensis]RKQ72117.1 ArsR family transcriptional regulator [Litorimonas taeanensis]